jgi:hypothetical protein
MAVFWVVAPCSLVEVYQRFRGPCFLHHQGDESDDPIRQLVLYEKNFGWIAVWELNSEVLAGIALQLGKCTENLS